MFVREAIENTENPNILDLEYAVLSQIQNIIEIPSTMRSFLEVLPPDCSSENVLNSMELESGKYNMTPAKYLLRLLGNKGYRVSDLIHWFQTMGLERALTILRKEESLRIISHPQKEVTVYEGSELLLTCTASSYPPPQYQWYKNDQELLLDIDPVLIRKSVSQEDKGVYTCLVTKWNSQKNGYEWLYSDFSNVDVIPVDLHAVPFNQEPTPSICNFETKAEAAFSSSFKQDGKENPSSKSVSVLHPMSVQNSKVPEFPPKQGDITIVRHPYVHGKIAQGMSLCLSCHAVSCSSSVNYQWFKNGRPLQGETSSQLILNSLYPDPNTGERKWDYQCEVYNEFDRAFSQTATVDLDETNNSTPYLARQKYAFMVANDTYNCLEHLQKPAVDVKDLANILSSLGFKIFALRNLTLTEMRNAFVRFCEMLAPGCYALFFFAGHGFELYGQTYLQPVDCSDNQLQLESMCSEYILQCMQEKNPAMNVLLIDACRKLPHSLSTSSKSQNLILPGRIFQAKMKNNTIYGYSTSFLSASHESDEEANSVFVKHLKKYINHDKCIQDILIMVQNDFARDPVARNVQFPVIKSTLAEQRKLSDPVQECSSPSELSDIGNWCDIKREIISKPAELLKIKSTIIVEFHHHMDVFCNAVDAYVYLDVKPNAEMIILYDMEINLSVLSPILDIVPLDGVALKDVGLLIGRRNFLFKKEIFNMQKKSDENFKCNIILKFSSKNITRSIPFDADVAKISKLNLSINQLETSNIEDPALYKNEITTVNSFD